MLPVTKRAGTAQSLYDRVMGMLILTGLCKPVTFTKFPSASTNDNVTMGDTGRAPCMSGASSKAEHRIENDVWVAVLSSRNSAVDRLYATPDPSRAPDCSVEVPSTEIFSITALSEFVASDQKD